MTSSTTPALDMVQTLALAGLTLALGGQLRRSIPVLARYNLPGPVLGGLVVALVFTALRTDGKAPLVLDTALQTPLMVAFFTTLGFGASARMLRAGGPQVFSFLLACSALCVLQNVLGVVLAGIMGLPALAGVLAGSVTLAGGPGTGLAFAPEFEAAGVVGAGSFAVASAMGGIVMGGLIGAPLGTAIITRASLRSTGAASASTLGADAPATAPASSGEAHLVRHLVLLLLSMGLGTQVSALINAAGVTLPVYIGCMLVAAALRNVDDITGWFRLDAELLDRVGSVSLSFFLAMALMTLKLWELANVALPLLVMLAAQGLLIVGAAVGVYRLFGRDYDAAVMSGGTVGFMLGTTANAMANMDALTRNYGPAPRAYLVVPLVGACFVDFANSMIITAFLGALRP